MDVNQKIGGPDAPYRHERQPTPAMVLVPMRLTRMLKLYVATHEELTQKRVAQEAGISESPVEERACGFPYCGGNAPECGQCLSAPKRLQFADVFADVCALMPEGVYWGEHLTPQMARDLVEAGVYAERKRWEEAMRLTWQMVDPLKPAGDPGSYWRGQDAGIVAALTTLRANLKTPNG